MNFNQNNPVVFISYSWDDEPHKEWVLNLANKLCENGIDVILDQYLLHPGTPFQSVIETGLSEAKKIIIIFTPNYKLKAEKKKGGVGHEYSIISGDLYYEQANTKKIIPILRQGTPGESMPSFMRQLLYADFTDDAIFENRFDELLEAIWDLPSKIKPRIGTLPPKIGAKIIEHGQQAGLLINKPGDELQEREPEKKVAPVVIRVDDISNPVEESTMPLSEASIVGHVLVPINAANEVNGNRKIDDKELQEKHKMLFAEGNSLKGQKKYRDAIACFDNLAKLMISGDRNNGSFYEKVIAELQECQRLLDDQLKIDARQKELDIKQREEAQTIARRKEYDKMFNDGLSLKNKNKFSEALACFEQLSKLMVIEKQDKGDFYKNVIRERDKCQKQLNTQSAAPIKTVTPEGISPKKPRNKYWIVIVLVFAGLTICGLVIFPPPYGNNSSVEEKGAKVDDKSNVHSASTSTVTAESTNTPPPPSSVHIDTSSIGQKPVVPPKKTPKRPKGHRTDANDRIFQDKTVWD